MPTSQVLYPPLDRETRSTRLLKFLPKREEGTISCTLTNHTLNDPPPFIGLSYVWGAPEPTYAIAVNSETLLVREGLWHAIQQLYTIALNKENCISSQRNTKSRFPEYFWIDAICINQDDVFERGYQVDLMKDIFSTATFVVSWVGDTEENVAELFEYLRNLKHTSRHDRPEFLRKAKKQFSFRDARWLVSRPYWSRIWIVQEFILPQELYILCGNDAISWPTLQQFRPFGISNKTNLGFKHLSKQENHHSIDRHVNSCRELSKLRRSWQTDPKQPSYTNRDPDFGARPTLTRLLAFCKDYRCSDPRDRVYGLLGLTDVEGEDRLLADYGITSFQLFHRVMSHLHQQGRVLSQIFRTRLAEGLQILNHDDLPTSAFIYEVVGGRNVKRLLVSDANVCKDQFLKDVVEYLGEDLRGDVESESSQFEKFLSHFQSFPVGEDSATWDLFGRAMRKAFEHDEDEQKI
ncbi:HETdomain-containing protein [Colletotrichum chrysophilum]|uniref:HETdomain-containing protein n=1 Tax=Colletotrichum chrysophilum TaxID=1836956 RepID=A0AAD9EKF7_9PEZI|nr:HETdomain-containing protein [Colletotrichum chrysophilum]